MPRPADLAPRAGALIEDDPPQTRTYALVLLTEAVVIAALYWLGVHFG